MALSAPKDAAIANGGVGVVSGRGEMAPPALSQGDERWVEGHKPVAGVTKAVEPVRQK
jgi:hypothetical protein